LNWPIRNPHSQIRNPGSMHIRKLVAHIVRLPLKRPFMHASAAREESENVLVQCELADGTAGWGEGVPRSYVTGETPQGSLSQLAATPLGDQLAGDCNDWPAALALCERFAPAIDRDNSRGCYGNALRCAVELSLLDAFGRLFGEPLSAAARHYRPAKSILASSPKGFVEYSAVIGAGSERLVRQSLARRLYGFRRCKVKVGASGDDDGARLATIRRWIGSRVDLRIDANEAWHADELLARLQPLEKFAISCVEQPLPHAEVGALAELRREIAIPIMLDESLTSEADALAAVDGPTCDLFNIRLSKCGGFLASLRIAALARAHGLGYQLGCHPGETGVLSAAGRHWATVVAGIRYAEGSYDRHLFDRLLTHEDFTFGYGGRAAALAGPGLGVTVNPAVLAEVTTARAEFDVAG
jgi:muconate cycloisomerase